MACNIHMHSQIDRLVDTAENKEQNRVHLDFYSDDNNLKKIAKSTLIKFWYLEEYHDCYIPTNILTKYIPKH